jgi:hypothetical protein
MRGTNYSYSGRNVYDLFHPTNVCELPGYKSRLTCSSSLVRRQTDAGLCVPRGNIRRHVHIIFGISFLGCGCFTLSRLLVTNVVTYIRVRRCVCEATMMETAIRPPRRDHRIYERLSW